MIKYLVCDKIIGLGVDDLIDRVLNSVNFLFGCILWHTAVYTCSPFVDQSFYKTDR